MKEQIVSRAYAQAIVELGESSKVDVATEMTTLTELINKNSHFENLLFLDVFTVEEKLGVFNEVAKKANLSGIVTNFVQFLLNEKRISLLPIIYKEVIVLDDHKKGFLRGVIEGREDNPAPEFVEKVKSFLKSELNKEVELTYEKTENVTAGYRVTVEDLMLDASLDNQLNKFKESILNS